MIKGDLPRRAETVPGAPIGTEGGTGGPDSEVGTLVEP